ncbi:ribonuclease H protein [Pyrus ussuriensis x Pyrus communis]|uniref:Ribonuclease H protein n=1 Tax=Pyrus ussuriensis x Pyrus communis TaxID=2448454 RepID=A0A5N5GN03_9ROSA|nr:ribonuclease H protein [Pyrus ussuriensis x Pyrus communis]
MREWLLLVVKNQKAKFDLVCMVLWGLWQARNSLVWDGHRGQPMKVVQKLVCWYHAFLAAHEWVKINIDRATRLEHFFWGNGSCVKGLDGEVFSSGSMDEGGYWFWRAFGWRGCCRLDGLLWRVILLSLLLLSITALGICLSLVC